MIWSFGLALLGLFSALLTTAQVHRAEWFAPPPEPLVWQAEPVESPWPAAISWSYQDAQEHAENTLQLAADEQAWCADNADVRQLRARLEAADDVDAVWRSVRTPLSDADQYAVRRIAEATAAARGMKFEALPPFWLVSRSQLRLWGCLSETVLEMRDAAEDGETVSTVGDAAEQFDELIGLRDARLTKALQRQLRITLWAGWYSRPDEIDGAADGVGNVYLVTRAPIPFEMVETISHEALHALQDQEADWRLHEMFDQAESSDALMALRWVAEGDASANQLSGGSPVLTDLSANHSWGLFAGLEIELGRRAAEALSPLEQTAAYAPYRDGEEVIARIARAEGQAGVTALLRDPPASTEQMIHADKLAANEPPLDLRDLDRVRRRLLPARQWQEPILDRMGEHWLRTLLAAATGLTARSNAAAAGWGGDQIALWQSLDDPAETVVTMQFVFDNPEEQREGAAGLLAWLAAHSNGEARQALGLPIVGWDGPAGAVRLITRRESLWLVAAASETTADQLAQGLAHLTLTDYWKR